MTVYHWYALIGIFAALAASIWLAWYLDRKKAITNLVQRSASKAYWVGCYRSVSDPTARENYSKLGAPAVLAAGGRFALTHTWDINGNVGRAPIKGFGGASAYKE